MIKNAISQAFFVSEKTGCFLTKIRLYVYNKSNQAPLKMQIRDIVNGYPGSDILDGSTVTILPADVTGSSTSLIPCDFVFDSPLFVEGERDYCIVIYTDASDYSLWSSRVGTADITGRMVDSQPTAGAMFTSQNGSTWVPVQTDTLTFSIYKAKFDIATGGEFVAVNAPISYRRLAPNPIQTYAGKSLVKVNHPSHGMNTGDYVYIDGVTIGEVTGWTVIDDTTVYGSVPSLVFTGGGASVQATGTVILRPDGTIAGVNMLTRGTGYTSRPNVSVGGGGANAAVVPEISPLGNGFVLTDFGSGPTKKMFQVTNVTRDSYMINLVNVATYSGFIGGSAVSATENLILDTMLVRMDVFAPPLTTIYNTRRTSSGAALNSPEDVFLHRNYDLPATQTVYSEVNERMRMNGEQSFTINTIMSSQDENLSPTIDVTSMSLNAISNRINSIDETNYFAGYDDVLMYSGGTAITFTSTGFTSADATTSGKVDTLQIGKPVAITGTLGFVSGIGITSPGSAYATVTVTIGTAWTSHTAVLGEQVTNDTGKLYTCITAGATAGAGGPTGTSTDITDGSAHWMYAGVNATATGTLSLSGGHVESITVTSPGYGYTTAPLIAITGSGGSGAAAVATIANNNGTFIVQSISASGDNRTVVLKDVTAFGVQTTVPAVGSPGNRPETVINAVQTYADDIISTGTSNLANYVSTIVTLRNQSTGFRVYFDANIPNEADVQLFYRIDKLNSSENIKKKLWTPISSDAALIKTSHPDNFIETVYTLQDAASFDQIQTKIVMKTTNTARVPRIKNFRVIVLA
jgi:hypothetical protein